MFDKWGEILSRTTKKSKENNISFESNSLNEFSLKGFIKFDIAIQTKGDKSKVAFQKYLKYRNHLANLT